MFSNGTTGKIIVKINKKDQNLNFKINWTNFIKKIIVRYFIKEFVQLILKDRH